LAKVDKCKVMWNAIHCSGGGGVHPILFGDITYDTFCFFFKCFTPPTIEYS